MKKRAENENTSQEDLLLPSAAARILGCSSAAVRQWIRNGSLPAVLLSGGWHAMRRADVEQLAAARAARVTQW